MIAKLNSKAKIDVYSIKQKNRSNSYQTKEYIEREWAMEYNDIIGELYKTNIFLEYEL